jgi:hypothetical protein
MKIIVDSVSTLLRHPKAQVVTCPSEHVGKILLIIMSQLFYA